MRILWKSVTLFRLRRVPVQVHTSCAYFPGAFFLWIGWSSDGFSGLLDGLIYLVTLYFSLLVHEFAHVTSGTWFGYHTRRVLLFPLGAMAEMSSLVVDPDEFVVALAGPLASALLGGLAWGGIYVAGGPVMASLRLMPEILLTLVVINFCLAAFNLLPVFPMDGGRMLRSGLAFVLCLVLPRQAHRSFLLATRVAVRYVGWPLALGMILLTVFGTHLWGHIVLFSLLPLMGEAEYWLLRQLPQFKGNGELAFLPPAIAGRRFAHRPLRGCRLILKPCPSPGLAA
jgi:Zn-dependent protease